VDHAEHSTGKTLTQAHTTSSIRVQETHSQLTKRGAMAKMPERMRARRRWLADKLCHLTNVEDMHQTSEVYHPVENMIPASTPSLMPVGHAPPVETPAKSMTLPRVDRAHVLARIDRKFILSKLASDVGGRSCSVGGDTLCWSTTSERIRVEWFLAELCVQLRH